MITVSLFLYLILTDTADQRGEYKTITYRPTPDDAINKFGRWITSEKFNMIEDILTASEQAKTFQDVLNTKLNEYCPLKTLNLSTQDKPITYRVIFHLTPWTLTLASIFRLEAFLFWNQVWRQLAKPNNRVVVLLILGDSTVELSFLNREKYMIRFSLNWDSYA